MVRFQTDLRVWLASMLVGLTTISGAPAATMVEDAALACGGLAASLDAVRIDSATLQTPSQLAVSERAPTPAARIAPANPAFCKVLGHIEPADPLDKPWGLARGYVTYGTDSDHERKPGEPPQVLALNDDAFENFAYRSY